MSSLRRIAEIPAGSWTKWAVVGFWLVILVLAFPLASKLNGAEKNDAKTWLPASAESTKVVDVQARFQPPNIYPWVVVYELDVGRWMWWPSALAKKPDPATEELSQERAAALVG